MHQNKNNLDELDQAHGNTLEVTMGNNNFSNVGRAKSNSTNKTPEIKN